MVKIKNPKHLALDLHHFKNCFEVLTCRSQSAIPFCMKIAKAQLLAIFLLSLFTSIAFAQTNSIKGRVFDVNNNEPIAFANIYIDSTTIGTTSDIEGNYEIKNLRPGTYNLVVSYMGYKMKTIAEVRVAPNKPTSLDIGVIEESGDLQEVTVTASAFKNKEESPVSLRTIGVSEIYRSPGGNRDISKVIQVLPGVGTTLSFRNDLIVRGGAPNENRFYLDGIEVPNINHFATQGASGGPVGLINVNFIREVEFYAGAFPANRGNALSSVLDFKQIEGNDENLTGNFTVGSSDFGLTLDGPLGEKSNFILSVRRSYLQLLFKALKLPFLPTYNDAQYKQVIEVNKKNRVSIIGLGAIDDFELNTDVNEGVTDETIIRRNQYILGNLPVNTQWNYAAGVNWLHYSENSFQNFIFSRNHLQNNVIKYKDNIEDPANLLIDYSSQEIENKFRFEHTVRKNGYKINAGLGYEYTTYINSTLAPVVVNGQLQQENFESTLNLNKYSMFGQVSKEYLENRLLVSFGLRTDINDYSDDMSNPIDQLSPRLSASYAITDQVSVTGNIGRYYQLPPYTVLGYRDMNDKLENRENEVTYIQTDHLIAGVEVYPTDLSIVSVEGFYKLYNDYPFLLRDSISLANLGGDFGVIGSEPVSSTSKGRSYGVEFLFQQKLSSSIYGICSYTYVRSEFENQDGEYVPSSWDSRHILNLTAGKKFKNNWELGLKFRFAGGNPYTPYDREVSAIKSVWDARQQGVFDYSRLNSERNPAFHTLDVRLDKKWFVKSLAINAYIDIQNLYGFESELQPFIDVAKDSNGDPITDPTNPNAYQLTEIENVSGTVLPSIGLMVEF